jgi:hypothetical protein
MFTPTVHDDRPVNRAIAHRRWATLYRVGAVAALVSALFIPIQIAVFLVWPPPLHGTAVNWFTLLRSHRLAGLVDLDLLLVADNVLLIPILLALYVVLRRAHEPVMTIAVALGFLSVLMYVATNPAIQMAALADRYAAAGTDVERVTVTAAGEAMLATWQGTAFHAAYLLGSVAGLLVGVVLLRSGVFSTATGWLAILANGVGFGLYLPAVGVYVAVFSVLFLEAWYLLIARRLARLGRGATIEQARTGDTSG